MIAGAHLNYSPLAQVRQDDSYRLILDFYADRTAERSGKPLMNHINEGLEILNRLNAGKIAMQAFCIHPLLQTDRNLKVQYLNVIRYCQGSAILYAMEYRNIANSFLSDKVSEAEYSRGKPEIVAYGEPKLSPLKTVNQMLIADKVQNRKDFLLYHAGSHQRTKELDHYFDLWLKALDVDEQRYQELTEGL